VKRARQALQALLAALLLATAGAPRARGQAPAPLETSQELQALADLMQRAVAEFSGSEQSRSIVMFDEIIARLESLRRQAPLPPRGKELLVQAHEHRGRAYYGIGLQDKAAESFRAAIQVQPQFALTKERVSPKIVDFFNSLKKDLVGFVAVTSKPAGARVSLNGEFLALTDFFPLEVLAGSYDVEVSREGYRSETRSVAIAPRATETLEFELVRTTASFFVITEPAGVEVWIDGELRATTPAGLAPDLHEAARGAGLDPGRASGRTEITGIAVGTRQLEFRRRCFEPVRRSLEVPEAQDYDVQPIKLDDSVGTLRLTSDPPGGLIFIDGEAMGQTPRELDRVCSGKHRLEVKHPSGKFVQDIALARNETLSLDCPIRPSLAFLGVVAESAAGERLAGEAEERLLQNLARIKSLNFVPAAREVVDRVLESERLARKAIVPGAGADPDAIRRATEKLAGALEVQGFLIAVLPGERLQRTAVLHLLAAGNTVSDTWSLAFAESASYREFLAAVDQHAKVYRPWSGIISVDTHLHDGVPVLRVVPGSPAAQAGIQPGEVIYAAEGQPIKETTELLRLVESKKPKQKLPLQLRGASGPRAIELVLGETPQEIPLNEPSLLYNKIMMDLRQQAEGYPGTETAAFARLNLGICAMHFGDFASAHEHLLKAKAELPQRPGVSQGTALYYLGLALERLGYKKEAVEAYRSAAALKDATLFNNDGPAVASLASRRATP
jgi:tetratricopeptide (TPR) repeat protein